MPGKPQTTVAAGRLAERIAEAYLRWNGLRLVERNYRSRFGEIDLIMLHGEVIVFVEVRSRSSSRFGSAGATVGAIKQRRLIRTAERFLQSHPAFRDRRCRFDVISMTRRRLPDITWIKDAIIQ